MTQEPSLEKVVEKTEEIRKPSNEVEISSHKKTPPQEFNQPPKQFETPKTLNKILEQKYHFQIPPEPILDVFYQTGNITTTAHSYSVHFKEYSTMHAAKPQKVETTAEKTSTLTSLAIYETNRFNTQKQIIYPTETTKPTERYERDYIKFRFKKLMQRPKRIIRMTLLQDKYEETTNINF